MTKNKKIALIIIAFLFAIVIGLGIYLKYSINAFRSSRDEKIIQAAKESLQFIDRFYKEKGLYPCAEDFAINFWNKKFRSSEYNDAGHPKVGYRSSDAYPYCDYKNDPQSFISLCYNLSQENLKAFGYKYYPVSIFGGSAGVSYCVSSSGSNVQYPDYRNFLGN